MDTSEVPTKTRFDVLRLASMAQQEGFKEHIQTWWRDVSPCWPDPC